MFEAMFLFLLTGLNGNYEEHYYGKVPHCDVADTILDNVYMVRDKVVMGYICIDFNAYEARRRFKELRIVQEYELEMTDEYKLRPKFKKKQLPKRKER